MSVARGTVLTSSPSLRVPCVRYVGRAIARYRLSLLTVIIALGLLAFAGPAAAGPFTWTSLNVDGTNGIAGISCPEGSFCVAVDFSGNVVSSANPAGGVGAWNVANITGTPLNAVSCPTTTFCVAVDNTGNAWWSTDPNGGAGTWSSASINGGAVLNAIDCPTTTLCVAGGNNGNVVWSTSPTGGPTAWTIAHIDGTNAEFSMSCPTTTFCATSNDTGAVWTTTTPTGLAGAWTAATVNASTVGLAMSCPSTTFCVLSNDSGDYASSTNPTGGAAAWTVSNLGFFTILYGVSCPTSSLCVSVDNGGNARVSTNPTGGAATWAADHINTGSLNGISCRTANLCVAVSNNGNAIIGTRATMNVTVSGTGTGTVTGSSIACPGGCTQTYPSGTLVTLTATPGADGSTFEGWSGACTGTGPCSTTMSADRSVKATFTAAPPGNPPVIASADPTADPTPNPAPTALPPPVVAQTANARPVSGKVLVQEAGTKQFVPLTKPEQVKFGTIFDTRKGSVLIVIANGRGGFDSATFSEGMFKLLQPNAKRPVAELDLFGGNFKGCPKAAKGGAARSAQTRGRSVRHLWGNGSGSFRTKGRYASATIRGTKGLTDDRCFGTLARVAVGSVTVRDLVKRKSVVVKAPKSYFARAK